ncbi:MAG: archease [Nitrososphaerota archaeon]
MKGEGFRQLPHMADIYIEAWGPTLEKAFEQAGLSLFKTLVENAEGVETSKAVEAEGYDLPSLLYDWLEKLLHLFELENLVGTEIRVEKLEVDKVYRLKAVVSGVKYDRNIHRTGTAVKSPTYALMEIDTEKNILRFLLDI